MPSRRALLTTIAAVSAGCTVGPGGTAVSPSSSEPPTATETDPLVTFDRVDVADVPSADPILVVAPEWRRWLRRAAAGETVRAAVNDPELCGRAPLDDVPSVTLRDADDRSGPYELTLETGGHYRYPFDAEPATPPENAPVYDVGDLPDPVASGLEPLLESGAGPLEPQTQTYEFVEAHTLDHEDYRYLLYVRRNDTTYRVSARIPTYTPACGFYVVFGLSATEAATTAQTLSLAGPADLDGSAKFDGSSRRLSAFPAATRSLLTEFEYVLTVSRCYRLDVSG